MEKNTEQYIDKFREGHQQLGGILHTIYAANLGSTLLSMFPDRTPVITHQQLQERYDLKGIWEKMSMPAELIILDPSTEKKETWKEKIAQIPASLTMPVAFIAFSGTVVFSSANDNSRLLSLLPPRHVVIGHVDQIVWRMEDFWAEYGNDLDKMGSNLFFVTGPSRTADIEKMLVRGVHGPHQFEVILITD